MTDDSVARQRVEWLTARLRSDDPYWTPIAACLDAHGIDTQTALLVDLWDEDVTLEHGIVVAASGQVFEFDFDWLHREREDGSFRTWRDVTASWGTIYGGQAVAAALEILGERS